VQRPAATAAADFPEPVAALYAQSLALRVDGGKL
jgi:hypothetical protein